MHKQGKKNIKEVSQIDNLWLLQDQDYLARNFTEYQEKFHYVFEELKNNPQWITTLLPQKIYLETKNWESAAALLETYSWLDLINISINKKNTAFIHFKKPYLKKYIHLFIDQNIHLFITKDTKQNLIACIGVPYITKDINIQSTKAIARSTFEYEEFSEWLLYDLNTFLNINPKDYKVRNDLTYIEKSIDIKNTNKVFS